MPRKTRIDMTGLRYGRLVGIAFSHTKGSGKAQWRFACDCGNEVTADGGNVRVGNTTSCGCFHREVCAARLMTHGHRASKRHDPTYRAWQLMIDACSNARSPCWRQHGARSVSIDPRWRTDFLGFLADVGVRPAGTVLARLDPSGNFTAANCVWAERRSRSARGIEGWRTRRAQS